MPRHHWGPSPRPEHGAAHAERLCPAPQHHHPRLGREAGGDFNSSESGGFTLSLEEPTPPPGNHCAVRNEHLKSSDPMKQRLESER